MAQVIKASAIDIKNLKFSDPRKVGNNGVQVVYINYGGGNLHCITMNVPKL